MIIIVIIVLINYFKLFFSHNKLDYLKLQWFFSENKEEFLDGLGDVLGSVLISHTGDIVTPNAHHHG